MRAKQRGGEWRPSRGEGCGDQATGCETWGCSSIVNSNFLISISQEMLRRTSKRQLYPVDAADKQVPEPETWYYKNEVFVWVTMAGGTSEGRI